MIAATTTRCRRATWADAELLQEVAEACGCPRSICEFVTDLSDLDGDVADGIVAEWYGSVAGYAIFARRSDGISILDMQVHPDADTAAVTVELFRYFKARLSASRPHLYAAIKTGNGGAAELFDLLGFRRFGTDDVAGLDLYRFTLGE